MWTWVSKLATYIYWCASQTKTKYINFAIQHGCRITLGNHGTTLYLHNLGAELQIQLIQYMLENFRILKLQLQKSCGGSES